MELVLSAKAMEPGSPIYADNGDDFIGLATALTYVPSTKIAFVIEDKKSHVKYELKPEQVIKDEKTGLPTLLTLNRAKLGLRSDALMVRSFEVVATAMAPDGQFAKASAEFVFVPKRHQQWASRFLRGLATLALIPGMYLVVALVPWGWLELVFKVVTSIAGSWLFIAATRKLSRGRKDWGVSTLIPQAVGFGVVLCLAGVLPFVVFARVGNPRPVPVRCGSPAASNSFSPGWTTILRRGLSDLETDTPADAAFCFVGAVDSDCEQPGKGKSLEADRLLNTVGVEQRIIGCRTKQTLTVPVAASCSGKTPCRVDVRDPDTCAVLDKPIGVDAKVYFPRPRGCRGSELGKGTASVVPPFSSVPVPDLGFAHLCTDGIEKLEVTSPAVGKVSDVVWSLDTTSRAAVVPIHDSKIKIGIREPTTPGPIGELECAVGLDVPCAGLVRIGSDVALKSVDTPFTGWSSKGSNSAYVCTYSGCQSEQRPLLGSTTTTPDGGMVGTQLSVDLVAPPAAGNKIVLPGLIWPLRVAFTSGGKAMGALTCVSDQSGANGVKLVAYSVPAAPTARISIEKDRRVSAWSPTEAGLAWACSSALEETSTTVIGSDSAAKRDDNTFTITKVPGPSPVKNIYEGTSKRNGQTISCLVARGGCQANSQVNGVTHWWCQICE